MTTSERIERLEKLTGLADEDPGKVKKWLQKKASAYQFRLRVLKIKAK